MTTWRDEIRRASFRGIAFDALQLGRDGGRRLVVEEGPRHDAHSIDDLGRKAPTFPLTAVLAGDTYQDVRDTLIIALESGGSGELLHPWRGVLEVHVETYSVRESSERLGSCEIDIAFHEAAAQETPLVIELHAPAATQASADAAIAASAGTAAIVNESLEPGTLPAVYRRQLEEALLVQATEWAVELGIDADDIYAVGTAYELASIAVILADSADLRALLRLVTALPVAASPTAGGRHDGAAHAAFAAFLVATQTAFICRAAMIAVETEWRTADEAADVLVQFADAFDALAESVNDEVSVALGALHAQVSDVLTESAITARRGTTIDVEDYTPAMVLAYELYGDCDREYELLRLNAQGDPATLRGPVKVLL